MQSSIPKNRGYKAFPKGYAFFLVVFVLTSRADLTQAQDLDKLWKVCSKTETSPDLRVAACTALINSGTGNRKALSWAFAQRGAGYDQEGAYNLALSDFDKAIALEPKEPSFYYMLAGTLHRQGFEGNAIDSLVQAVRLDKTYAEAWNNLCWERSAASQLEQAFADCGEAIRLKPADPATLDSLGFIELKSRKYMSAISYYDTAIRNAQSMPSPYFGRGVAKYTCWRPIWRRSRHKHSKKASTEHSRNLQKRRNYTVAGM